MSLADQDTHDWHEDVVHDRSDDFSERRTDDDAYRQVDDISLECKPELLDHPHRGTPFN
jgi:hypothetical protein